MSDSTLSKYFPADKIKAQLTSRFQGRISQEDAPRRTTHGSHAWSLPSQFQTLRQPQDGALENVVETAEKSSSRKRANVLREAEDAHLSGTMRSLARRVLGLNVTAPHSSALANQPERYFAEPHLPRLLKSVRKGPDATRPRDGSLTHPQVA